MTGSITLVLAIAAWGVAKRRNEFDDLLVGLMAAEVAAVQLLRPSGFRLVIAFIVGAVVTGTAVAGVVVGGDGLLVTLAVGGAWAITIGDTVQYFRQHARGQSSTGSSGGPTTP